MYILFAAVFACEHNAQFMPSYFTLIRIFFGQDFQESNKSKINKWSLKL